MPKEIKPVQIDPAINPQQPTEGSERFQYYLLEKPTSPSIAPPNAVKVVQYKRRQFLHDDPDDFRRPYGYAEYERELSFEELDRYNLLPFDRDQILLFDLWQNFGKDKEKISDFLVKFFNGELEPQQKQVAILAKLADQGWTLEKAQKELSNI